MMKVGRVARHNLCRLFAAGKGRVQRIVNASTHDAPAPRLVNGRFVIRQRQCLHPDRIAQPQSQFGCRARRHLVKAREGRERFRQSVDIGKRPLGVFQRRQTSRVFRMRLQDRSGQYSGVEEGQRV
jgi:hypothetical protein